MTQQATTTVRELEKTQSIRLADVFLVGPMMLYAASFKALPDTLRIALAVTGIATIIYNGDNYLKNLKNIADGLDKR